MFLTSSEAASENRIAELEAPIAELERQIEDHELDALQIEHVIQWLADNPRACVSPEDLRAELRSWYGVLAGPELESMLETLAEEGSIETCLDINDNRFYLDSYYEG